MARVTIPSLTRQAKFLSLTGIRRDLDRDRLPLRRLKHDAAAFFGFFLGDLQIHNNICRFLGRTAGASPAALLIIVI